MTAASCKEGNQKSAPIVHAWRAFGIRTSSKGASENCLALVRIWGSTRDEVGDGWAWDQW